MKMLTYKEFAAKAKISTRTISTYRKRGHLITGPGKFVDIENPVNKAFSIKVRVKRDGTAAEAKQKERIEKIKTKEDDKIYKFSIKSQKADKRKASVNNKLKCPLCSLIKSESDYSIKNITADSICDKCKILQKECTKTKRAAAAKARKQNPDVARKSRNKRILSGKRADDERRRRANNPLYKFSCCTRTTIYMSLRKNGFKKSEKTESILGCPLDYFKKHIESLFSPGMSFDNYGSWHIDHIIPLATAKTEQEVIALNHYTNLRPLWAIDNLRKGSKIAA